jgi:hypothetical protein
MSLNSRFNCLYCLVFVFYPVNICLDPRMTFFCSSIYTYVSTQLFKIGCVAYLGESIKLCANISYILITVNRYMLIGREHSPLLERISKLEFKHIVWFSLCFSFVLNTGRHIFQYMINDGNKLYPKCLSTYYLYVEYPVSVFNSGRFFSICSISYFMIDCVLFFVINTRVEIVTVRKFHAELKEKRRKMQ